MAALPPPAPAPAPAQKDAPLHLHSWTFYPLIWLQAAFLRLVAACPAMKDPIPDDIDVVHTTIPSRDAGRSIKCAVYRAKGVAPSGKVLLNWHGSGFILPRWGEDKRYCAFIAGELREHGVTVYDLDYRKAPENPFPCLTNDAEDAILHFASLDETTHIVVGGFSAGAMIGIAAAAATRPVLEARNSKARVGAIAAIYPASDMRPTAKRTPPVSPPRSGAVIAPWVGRVFTNSYLVHPDACHDKRASLILHGADELPPHFVIITGSADSLHDDSVDFINQLNSASPPHPDAKFISIENEGHAWDKDPKSQESIDTRDQAYRAALEYVKKGLDIK
ncbi:hypothetical protein OC835_001165 [Tilletia horrida]|nr:hypothetical protein OC835_001165 [Tilletia horrida]